MQSNATANLITTQLHKNSKLNADQISGGMLLYKIPPQEKHDFWAHTILTSHMLVTKHLRAKMCIK